MYGVYGIFPIRILSYPLLSFFVCPFVREITRNGILLEAVRFLLLTKVTPMVSKFEAISLSRFVSELGALGQLWFESGELPPSPKLHFTRAAHMANDCVNCGQCEDACPVEIPLSTFFQQSSKEFEELFARFDELTSINYE